MRISLRWLRDYAALDAPLSTLVQALVDTGTEVDDVHRDAEGAVVARVLALTPVPKSKRGVRIADIDAGGAEPVRLLTGAPNVSVGDLVVWAPPGTRLPGWDEPVGTRVMFGMESPGFLCSAVELGLGDDADGLLLLERGVPGQPAGDVLDLDAVLEVEVTPNRPDCLCHVGIARELSAALGEPLNEPPAAVPEALLSVSPVENRVGVRVEDPQGCPRFLARVIEDVAIGPSPGWMQRRLRAAGLNPINNVVDVTNFVMLELGQPLHAFDLDRFRQATPGGGAAAQVVVRRARAGERIVDLGGREHQLQAHDLVVCAGTRPVSVAGVIGGDDTGVVPGTRTVLLEAATWDGPSIRATSRRILAKPTDASMRFSRGLSDTLSPAAIDRAAALIAETGAGRVLRGTVDEHRGALPPPPPIEVPEGRLEEILGCPVDPGEAATALARLGFTVEQEGGRLRVVPPHFRRDVRIPVDVAEEVGRSLGYGRVPSTLPGRRRPVGELAPHPPVEEGVRDVLVGAGLDEAITYSFTAPAAAARLGGAGEGRPPIPLRNPLSEEWSVMRTSLLPGLCGALALNLNQGLADVALFEIGRAYWEGERTAPPPGSTRDGADAALPPLPEEPLLLGLVSQSGDGRADTVASRIRHLQSVLAFASHDLAGLTMTIEPDQIPGLRPGRSGRIVAGGRAVGVIGELDPDVLEGFELRGRVAAAELRLDGLVPEVPRTPRFRQPPRHPAVVLDLSVTVPAEARIGTALEIATEAAGSLLESVEVLDEYRGEAAGAGKSWTFRLTFRAPDRTLNKNEAQVRRDGVAAALETRLGAEVRR
ncbi:MAG TPA: phenylalanine--tRNA ligase subunit beta [Candidatus Dormibacteraeota bacterium]|nr:phenylalanine--tRNA ligase subunit beta [Candidatus Dormibacteraeota bacterium]